MFENRDPLGARVNVLNSCASFLVEAISTQATGSRQYTAPSSRTMVGIAAVRRSRPRRLPWPGRRLPVRPVAEGGPVSAPAVRVSAMETSPSLEDALGAYPEQEVRAREHDGGDNHRQRGGFV